MQPKSTKTHLQIAKEYSRLAEAWFLKTISDDPTFFLQFGNIEIQGNYVTFSERFSDEIRPNKFCRVSIEMHFIIRKNVAVFDGTYIKIEDYTGERRIFNKQNDFTLHLLKKIAKGETKGWKAVDYYDMFVYPEQYGVVSPLITMADAVKKKLKKRTIRKSTLEP